MADRDLLSDRLGGDADLFQRFLDTAPDAMLVIDETGLIIACNEQTYAMFRFPNDQLRGEEIEKLVPQRFRAVHPRHRERYFKDPKVRPMGAGIDLFGVRSDGVEFPVEISLSPMHLETGLLVTAAVRDLTERKDYEEEIRLSRSRLQEAQAVAHIGSWEFDLVTGKLTWSDELYRIYGQVPGQGDIDFESFIHMVHEEDRELVTRTTDEAVATGEPFSFEHRIRIPDGEIRWLLGRGNVVKGESGQTLRMHGTAQDITTLHENEERIRRSLAEKEILLKEIHHRVKNNLQVIASLLNLQRNTVEDPAARSAFAESRNRIKTMALVHESLYRSSDLTSIRAPEYLGKLIHDLYHSYAEPGNEVRLEMEIEPIALPTDVALHCGLILNELISNAIKHAFPHHKGSLHIRFQHSSPGRLRLVVSDDGPGIRETPGAPEGSGLGLRLVNTLTQQLHGTLERGGAPGTTFIIDFPIGVPPETQEVSP